MPAYRHLTVNTDWTQFDSLISAALAEDAVAEDVTTRSIIQPGWETEAEITAGQDGVICGLPLLQRTCRQAGGNVVLYPQLNDGDALRAPAVVARVAGAAGALLSLERVLLNFLQRLSGIATLTRRFVDAVAGSGAEILDTRKTLPGWRTLEKYAVRCGGGMNHRMNLGDQVLIKENHLRLVSENLQLGRAAAVVYALKTARNSVPDMVVSIEVEDLSQLKTALACEPDIVLLDNFPPEGVPAAVKCIGNICSGGVKRPLIEVSGGIDIQNVCQYAALGVDRISIGALTHSAPALDMALNIP